MMRMRDFWFYATGVIVGIVLFSFMAGADETAARHCRAYGFEEHAILHDGRIECIKVTREVVQP